MDSNRSRARAGHHDPGQEHRRASYKGVKINIVDTPGHADFGGEVERILQHGRRRPAPGGRRRGADAADAVRAEEGAGAGLRRIVVINKIDRPDAADRRVHRRGLGLFIDLDASDEQLDAPFLYDARAGTARPTRSSKPGQTCARSSTRSSPTCRRPRATRRPFQMLISTLDFTTSSGGWASGGSSGGRWAPGEMRSSLLRDRPEEADEAERHQALHVRRA